MGGLFPVVLLLMQADSYAAGMRAFERGEVAAAIPLFESAVRGKPGNAEYQRVLGIAYAAAGEFAKARKPLEFACGRAEGDACYNLARALYYGDQYDAALEVIGKARAGAAASAMRGMILAALGRGEQSARAFDEALRAKPSPETEGRIRLDYGIALYRDGRMEAALAEFDRAAERLPGEARVQKERGRALRQLGRGNEATGAFRKAIELGDRSEETRRLAEVSAR